MILYDFLDRSTILSSFISSLPTCEYFYNAKSIAPLFLANSIATMDQVQELITSTDKTPLVKILTWMFLSVSVLAAIARIATKLNMVGKLGWDDYLTTVSAVSTCHFTEQNTPQMLTSSLTARGHRSIRSGGGSVRKWLRSANTYAE